MFRNLTDWQHKPTGEQVGYFQELKWPSISLGDGLNQCQPLCSWEHRGWLQSKLRTLHSWRTKNYSTNSTWVFKNAVTVCTVYEIMNYLVLRVKLFYDWDEVQFTPNSTLKRSLEVSVIHECFPRSLRGEQNQILPIFGNRQTTSSRTIQNSYRDQIWISC